MFATFRRFWVAINKREMRSTFAKTALVVDEGSLASTVQARNLLRIADALRIPRVVLVGDAKQLDAVDAGKPFAQLQKAGMKTAVMDEIMRQRDPALSQSDPQLRDVDRAWASTVHAFQGRTVDTVVAAMEANHPHLTTQKSFYVEISRARDRAELVTDDKAALKEQLEAATGERIAALEAVEPDKAKGRETSRGEDRGSGREQDTSPPRGGDKTPGMERDRAPKSVDRGLGL